MFEVIISNINNGHVHRWMLETSDGARQYANDWLEMKRDQAERVARARGTVCNFAERNYRVEIEYVEKAEQMLEVSAATERVKTRHVAAAA